MGGLKINWLNLALVELGWAAMVFFTLDGWFQRIFGFVFFNVVSFLWARHHFNKANRDS